MGGMRDELVERGRGGGANANRVERDTRQLDRGARIARPKMMRVFPGCVHPVGIPTGPSCPRSSAIVDITAHDSMKIHEFDVLSRKKE